MDLMIAISKAYWLETHCDENMVKWLALMKKLNWDTPMIKW